MKKFAFIFAFSALFAVGLSAQTVSKPKTAPMPKATTATATRSTASNSGNTVAPATTADNTAPATKPKHRFLRANGKAAKAAQPVAKNSQQLH